MKEEIERLRIVIENKEKKDSVTNFIQLVSLQPVN